jgi:hypothetical protein
MNIMPLEVILKYIMIIVMEGLSLLARSAHKTWSAFDDYEQIFTWAGYQPAANPPILEEQGFYSGVSSLRQVAYRG